MLAACSAGSTSALDEVLPSSTPLGPVDGMANYCEGVLSHRMRAPDRTVRGVRLLDKQTALAEKTWVFKVDRIERDNASESCSSSSDEESDADE
ncbi:hypothetical protein EON66_08825 [archaeon]|nr:MAG: hypothetical protein EON66_08825 [archaeon]